MKHFLPGPATLQGGTHRRSSRRWVALAVATATASIALVWATPGTSQAAPCPYSGDHYKAQAVSGYGTNKGTGGWMDTWSNWSLDGHTASTGAFSNEAVWSIDHNNFNNALEVGFNVGTGADTSVFENYMYPYYTLNNGGNERDYVATVLPTNSTIWNSATSDGTNSWAYVNNTLLGGKAISPSYGVATPRWNYEQAEVNYHDIWMAGGSAGLRSKSMFMSCELCLRSWLDMQCVLWYLGTRV